jgi:hypothetical protein
MTELFFRIPIKKIVLCLLIATISGACQGAGPAPAKPTIRISAPSEGTPAEVGQPVLISYEAGDVKGVVQVEITVNGQPIHVETVAPPVNVFSGSYRWRPENSGSHLIQAVTFNVDGIVSDTAQVALTVGRASSAVEPTPTLLAPPDTPTTVPTLTVSPTPADPTPTASPDSAGLRPLVTVLVGLNVRSGPSTEYPVIGRLREGDTADITGRNGAGTWWQIAFISADGERGWLAAGANFSTASNTGAVPVVPAPPLEPTPTAKEPAPDPNKPVINFFRASRESIVAGEPVNLEWDLENAREAYLRYDGVEEGVVSPANKTVSPNKATTYTLVARNDAGETTMSLTIQVQGATPTPGPVLDSGRFSISNGQTIDFDRGLVQGDGAAGADFLWDVGAREFRPRNGASGALINKPFDTISLVDCSSATYGIPIVGVDGSVPIVGCYKTSEARFGKFVISGWEITGKVTIDWLTWGR